MALEVGQDAPTFSLDSTTGRTMSLEDLRGKKVVLYFYPKDDTPGCTAEACSFRDHHTTFKKKDVVVLGVSPDGAKAHTKFIEKFSLPFPLLSDEDHAVCEAYNVWVEKSMYGKKFMGVERSTFVIGPDGKLQAIYRKVKPETHTADVL